MRVLAAMLFCLSLGRCQAALPSWLALGGIPAQTGVVVNALSGSWVDVSNAMVTAGLGGTVNIPAGTFFWTRSLTVSQVRLVGAGTNLTIINDETPVVGNGNGTPLVLLNGNATNFTRVTGIHFMYGVTNNQTTFNNNNGPEIQVGGAGNWRIDHCLFEQMSGKDIKVVSASFGCIDQNTFLTKSRISAEIYGLGYGDADWASPVSYGSSNAVFFEDNVQIDDDNFGWTDISGGGREVARGNKFFGCFFNTHGAETPGRYRSAYYQEVYNNIFSNTVIGNFNNIYAMVDFRGGSGIVLSNTGYGYNTAGIIRDFRGTDNDPGFAPWYGCTGTNGWDGNGALLLSGTTTDATATGKTNLVVTGAGWTVNQWVGHTVFNVTSNRNGVVTANTSDTMQFAGSRHAFQVGFKVGDSYQVRSNRFMFDQPGAGQCDILSSADNPTAVYLNFTPNPIMVGSNVNYKYGTFVIQSPVISSIRQDGSSPEIVDGRDVSNNVVIIPGWVPYTYPHPLRLK